MADVKTGELWALIQQWLDAIPYPPSQRRLAARVGVSSSALTEWKYGRGFPTPDNLKALAEEIGVPYERVLDAALIDRGYRTPRDPKEASEKPSRTPSPR